MEIGRLVLGLIVLTAMVVSVAYVNNVTRCQTDFNVAYAAASRERNVIADQWRTEQIAYLKVIQDRDSTSEDRRSALDDYIAKLELAAEQRDATPLPENPRCR
jgi:phage terminase Nu1 subunit (DNA packaging protein)